MSFATTDDCVRLRYEEAGEGEPILFVHEFAGGESRATVQRMARLL